MTPEELEVIRLGLRIEALKIMLSAAYTAMATLDPRVRQSLLGAIELARTHAPSIPLAGLPPEYSDLIDDEFHEALEELLSALESGLK